MRGGIFIKGERVTVSGVYLIRDATKIHLHTNRRQKWVKIFFAVWVFLFFSVFSAYLNYNYCADADFPSSKPRFENPDQDYLLADQRSKWSAPGKSTTFFILEPYLFRFLPLPSFEISSLNQKFLVLRC